SAVNAANLRSVALGIACFCAISSAVYILNDYRDRESDRMHPRKKHRPLASGTVPVPLAFALMAALLAFALVGAFLWLPREFFWVVALYFGVNVAYTFGLKSVAILDVMVIALGFVFRVEGGAILIGVEASAWLVIATGLLALFLAVAKRRDDLVQGLDASHRKSIEGYSKPFLDSIIAVILGALLVTYLIYATDINVMQRLGTTKVFYTTPFVVAGILRYLQITMVEERSGSPTRILLTDRMILWCVIGWIATFVVLIYGRFA
ncbi:MAG: UbiA prenyltransferase family protein, partial [Alphaproteobacteria bacterium]|nr:UbiA prenyltransferase family protein [Alphaproteobacteria bacterium]